VAPPGTESLPQALREQIVGLLATTQETRELAFLELPKVAVVTPAELADRVKDQIAEDLEDVDQDAALLSLLGLLPAGTDLATLYRDLYGEAVAGFYDPELGELVVPSGSNGFSPLQAVTMVHELTHALTDQHYPFQARLDQMDQEQRFDEAAALQALLEGDAEFTSLQYLLELPDAERFEVIQESLAIQTDNFDAAPVYLRELLTFPYVAGFEFVDMLHRQGGFVRVGEVYLSPPESTEQILAPRRFETDHPFELEVPVDLPGYEVVEESTWGQLLFTVMFRQLVPGDQGEEAAAGWGGDRYRMFWDGENVALVLAYAGDESDDLGEMEAALRAFVAEGMQVGDGTFTDEGVEYFGDDYASIDSGADRLFFVAASDPEVGPSLRLSLRGG